MSRVVKVLKEYKEDREYLDPKVLKEHRVVKVFKVMTVLRELRVHKVFRDLVSIDPTFHTQQLQTKQPSVDLIIMATPLLILKMTLMYI